MSPYTDTNLVLDDLISQQQEVELSQSRSTTSRGYSHGQFISSHRGQGLEFDDLREYTIGDDVRHIDWKVSARHQKTMTRLFREERDSTVTLLIDLRRSMNTGTTALRSITTAHLSAALAWHCTSRGQRISTIIASEHGIHSSPPFAGERGALTVCKALHDAFYRQHSDTQKPERELPNTPIQPLFEIALQGGRKLGSTVFLSGFDEYFSNHTQSNYLTSLSQLKAKSSQHSQPLFCVLIQDDAEIDALPTGRYGYRSTVSATRGLKAESRVQKILASNRARFQSTLNVQTKSICTALDKEHISYTQHTGVFNRNKVNELIQELTVTGVCL